jgi:outer membrane protein OmpA-like peptidoglycan-associated protein
MSLSLMPEDRAESVRRSENGAVMRLLVALLVLMVLGLGYLGYEMRRRGRALEQRIATLEAEAKASSLRSVQALERAMQAEGSAQIAAEGRHQAEAKTATAQQEADAAKSEATTAKGEAAVAKDEAAKAQAETARIRKAAEAEMDRLNQALSQVGETQRTALGVVMNLGSDYLKFEFDKAELRPEDKELLSRVAGILLTSKDYTVSVNGHTDDVGSAEYNQKLSERRAQAVRDYLVKAGLPAEILSVTGHGKSLPLVKDTSEKARAKNRRVELGIANTRIKYGLSARTNG